MSNPFYNPRPQGGGMSFPQFMQMMRGRDPNQILDSMLRSGQINERQLAEARQKAQSMSGMFEQFRRMFGF